MIIQPYCKDGAGCSKYYSQNARIYCTCRRSEPAHINHYKQQPNRSGSQKPTCFVLSFVPEPRPFHSCAPRYPPANSKRPPATDITPPNLDGGGVLGGTSPDPEPSAEAVVAAPPFVEDAALPTSGLVDVEGPGLADDAVRVEQ